MSKKGRYSICGRRIISFAICAILFISQTGCTSGPFSDDSGNGGTMGQSAADQTLDIASLQVQNPDIFGWIYIPDTNINYPILQNLQGDDEYYITHDCTGAESSDGAIYLQSANLSNMCDFIEILHGNTINSGIMFSGLSEFLDKEYFDEHPVMYIYINGNALAYEIYAAYECDYVDVLRSYDLTDTIGCQEFINDMEADIATNGNVRTGWEEGVTPYNFLVCLTTNDLQNPNKQINVIGCMIGDAAGTIDREIE
jgi:sortase B